MVQAQLHEAQSAAGNKAAALQSDITALQRQLEMTKADLAEANSKVEELQQQLEAQQAQQAQHERHVAARMEQMKMDVSSCHAQHSSVQGSVLHTSMAHVQHPTARCV